MKTKKVLALLVLAAMIMSIVPAMAFGGVNVYNSVVDAPAGSSPAQTTPLKGADDGAIFTVTIVKDNGTSYPANIYVASSRSTADYFFYRDDAGNWNQLAGQSSYTTGGVAIPIAGAAGTTRYLSANAEQLTLKVVSTSAGTSQIAFGIDGTGIDGALNTAAFAMSRSTADDSNPTDSTFILQSRRFPAEFTSPKASRVFLNVRAEDKDITGSGEADGKYANGVDNYRLVAFVQTDAGVPVSGMTVNFSIVSGTGAYLSETSRTTNASGSAEIRVYSTRPGIVDIRARIANVQPSNVLKSGYGATDPIYLDMERVTFKPTGVVKIIAETGQDRKIARESSGYSWFRFSSYDAMDYRVDWEDTIPKNQRTNITNLRNGDAFVGPESLIEINGKPHFLTIEFEVIDAPSGAALKSGDITYDVHYASGDLRLGIPFDKLNKDGKYEVRLHLINGSSITWTFYIKDLGDVVNLILSYPAKSFSAGTVLPEPGVIKEDAEGYSSYTPYSLLNPRLPLSISRTEFMEGMMEPSTGRLKLRNDMSGPITMTVVDRDLNLVANADLTIEKAASMLKLTPQLTVTPVNGDCIVDILLVDIDGKAAATGLRANTDPAVSRAAIISAKRANEVSSASRPNLADFNAGKASVRVSSNMEGDITLQVIIKEVVEAMPGVTVGGLVTTTSPRRLQLNGANAFWASADAKNRSVNPTTGYSLSDTALETATTAILSATDQGFGSAYEMVAVFQGVGIIRPDATYPTLPMVQVAEIPNTKIGTLDDLSVTDKFGGRTYTGAVNVSFGVSSGAGGTIVFIIGAPSFVSGNMAFVAESPAFIDNGRTYLGVRDTATSIDATLDWDQDTQTATISKGNIVAKITVGAEEIALTKAGTTTTVAIDFPAINKDGRVYVPIRALLQDIFGYTVTWNNDGQSIVCNLE